MRKQLIPIILLIAILSGCNSVSTVNPSDDTDLYEDTLTDTAALTETDISLPDAVDYAGETITVLSRLVTGHYCYPYHEFIVTEESGDIINDAILKRNRAVEEKYNVVFEAFEEDDVGAVAQKSILAGDSVYDILLPMHASAYQMSVQGVLSNMEDLPHIDKSRPYWHTSIMNNTSIGEKNYFLTGDLNLSTLNGVGVL